MLFCTYLLRDNPLYLWSVGIVSILDLAHKVIWIMAGAIHDTSEDAMGKSRLMLNVLGAKTSQNDTQRALIAKPVEV